VSYADYYERALTNGVLSIQRGTDPGVMIYMLPLGLGVSKAKTYHSWGRPLEDFWCCYGTGVHFCLYTSQNSSYSFSTSPYSYSHLFKIHLSLFVRN